MKRYARMEGNVAVGFWHDDVHGPRLLEDGSPNADTKIPADAVEVSEAEYKDLLANRSAVSTDLPADVLARAELGRFDNGRILEHLVATLIQKGVIALSDLPAPARQALVRRAQLRQLLGQS